MKWLLIPFILMGIHASAQEYYFRQMPTDYGDDIQQINLLFQGSDQMIWLGTDKGLYSFDGKKYRLASRPDNVVQGVSTIAEYPNGEIWAGYQDGSIQVVTVKGFRRSIPTDSIRGIPVSKILFHPDGSVYIATYGAGLWQLKDQALFRIRFQHLDQLGDIYDALIDDQGSLWIGTDHGIWIYKNKPQQHLRNLNKENGLPDEIVTELQKDDKGDIWIGFYDHGIGRYLFNKDSVTTVARIDSDDGNVVSLVSGLMNGIWLGTDKSVSRFSSDGEQGNVLIPLQIKDHIEDLLLDRTSNLWLASGNKLYMANTQLEHSSPGVSGIQAIASIGGMLWLGCEEGLFSVEKQTGKLQQHLKDIELNILSIYVDAEGILWIGTFGQGLYIYDPSTRKVRNLTEKDNISNNSILNIDGKDRTVWLATLGGITQINWMTNPVAGVPQVTLFNEKFNFPAGYVYDVYVANDGKVWFGTDGKGLYYLEDQQLHSFTHPVLVYKNDSFDIRTIYSITGDQKKNIWLSATKGNILGIDSNRNVTEHIASPFGSLNSLNTSGSGEIIMVREGAIQIKSFTYGSTFFTSETGLNSFSPKNVNATWRDIDGSVWIADTDEVLHYRPVFSDTGRYVHMHLMDMTPGALYHEGPVRLRHDSNFLDFRFTGLWYPDPESVGYRYMLEGHDEDWIYTQEGRAVYSKLSPGTYTFLVAGSHHNDFSQSLPIRKEIIVLPPFYLTWWFIAGTLSVILFLTYRYTRDRIRRINRFHELEKEKTTLQLHAIQAQVNPHFLFNSFNTLSGIIEEDQEAAIDYVDQMSSFFRGVLMHRDAELITLAEEIEIMRNYTYILKKRYGDNIVIIEDIKSSEGFIAPLTLQLLVENAIKHNKVSNDKPLHISITADVKWITVSNPLQPKIQSTTESTGFGLSSLLTRYQYLTTSKIEIINDGQKFIVRIPVIHLNT